MSNSDILKRDKMSAPNPVVSAPEGMTTLNDVNVSPESILIHLTKLQTKVSETPDGIPSIVYKRLGEMYANLSLNHIQAYS